MNYNNNPYNQPYVQTITTYGRPQPYYNQPMIVQPQPRVVVVQDRYAQNNLAAA